MLEAAAVPELNKRKRPTHSRTPSFVKPEFQKQAVRPDTASSISSSAQERETGRGPTSDQAQHEPMSTAEEQAGRQPEAEPEARGSSSQTQPAAQPEQPATQPAQPAARTEQRWSTKGMPKNLGFVWRQLEFANPETWSEAQVQELQGWLTRFLDGNTASRYPARTLPACAALQGANKEVCWYQKSYNNVAHFTGTGPCNECLDKNRPCYRITDSGVAGKKWLITRR